MKVSYIIYLYIVAILIGMAVLIIYRRYVLPDRTNDKIDDMFTPKTNTETLIYKAAIERLLRKFTEAQSKLLAGFMVAQSKHETANYTSNVFKNNNNAFGYKYYKGSLYQLSAGTGSPEGNAYAKYRNVQDSAREVADWIGRGQTAFSAVKTIADFATALKNGRPGYEYYHTPSNQTAQASINNYIKGMTYYYNA